MKKSTLIVVSAAAMLFLAACSGNKPGAESSEPATSQKESAHKHSYGEWTETKAPTCTEKGEKERTCTGCGEKQTQAVSAAGHKYVKDDAKSQDATCTEGGKLVEKCSVCGNEKETATEALGHDLVKAEDQTGAVTPTCEDPGTEIQECSRCHEKTTVDVEATGHTWGETTWTKEATCTDPSEGSHKCETCNKEEAVSEPALGHDVQLIGDDTEPEEGKAKVRLYTCANECGTTYLGFKANEVTEESKKHLTIGEDGGAAFWGRPIGNNLELDENGTSVNQQVGELVFDETQTGDFFEYKFDLTEEQAAVLNNCQLYCDAKPAGYMSNNRVDFWAYGADSSDWTPGAYIEGDRKGELVDDFRYVLYVDGERKDLDKTVSTPVGRGDPRAEYVLPYTFNLHKGENSIRLVMSGGYRSTFYNFTFRPVEEKEPDPEPEHTHAYTAGTKTGAMTAISCSCGKTGVQMAAADLTEGQKAPVTGDGGKNTRLGKDSKFDDVWNIEGIAAGKYEIYLEAAASSGNSKNGYWNSATAIKNGDKASNNGNTAELQADYKYKVKVDDGAYVNLGNDVDNYAATGLKDNEFAWTTKALATIDIAAGAKTLTIHNMDNGYSIWVNTARLVKIA
ncbi:MAG: hypothetical protein MJ241_01600 [Bacilli bacterium]|nr:hypothetical protein [Bacilli bacterium]